MQQQFSSISERARELLAGQESHTAEFKESLSGLSADDLVAFANCETGGTILIGVREGRSTSGLQSTEIVGEPVGDREKLSILNKASSCSPPVTCSVIFENLDATPFIRIEIPPQHPKPFCTSGGTYKIRNDALNLAMTPGMLLAMFIDRESGRFFRRFNQATEKLHSDLDALNQQVHSTLEDAKGVTKVSDELAALRAEIADLKQAIKGK